jgi:hypothetical protein
LSVATDAALRVAQAPLAIAAVAEVSVAPGSASAETAQRPIRIRLILLLPFLVSPSVHARSTRVKLDERPSLISE